jgi:hypothetical protein
VNAHSLNRGVPRSLCRRSTLMRGRPPRRPPPWCLRSQQRKPGIPGVPLAAPGQPSAGRSAGKMSEARLHALGTAVRSRFGDQVWTVAELSLHGMVEPGETRALGRALGGVHGADGLIAGALLVRHGATRDGGLWQLKDPRW